ncbi:MAG: NAD(P)H-dependent oxidoreductase [Desulfatibacillaceae bacterium]|nr:NAD(P)H-dependent oxidoreductase [Desulfatibacillaceae bacterium]
MQAVILNSADKKNPAAAGAVRALKSRLDDSGWSLEVLNLAQMDIAPCTGCFACWTKTPGRCIIPDQGDLAAKALVNSQLAVFLTPLSFGGYNFHLKKALDRIICVVSPFFTRVRGEIHHQKRYDSYPKLLGIGLCEHPDKEAQNLFAALVEANAKNLHAPAEAAITIVGRPGGKAIAGLVDEALQNLAICPAEAVL